MAVRTKFVILMHPKEFKQEKAGTGRLTHLCLRESEIHMGIGFDQHEAVQELIADPRNYTVLLYPGSQALNLSNGELPSSALADRRLVVFILDATWNCARKMLRLSPSLQRLPRVMFTPAHASRFVIKQQPEPGCLSTLEAVHELLCALDRTRLDHYADPSQLLDLFSRMQAYQLQCASDPNRTGYRHRPYTPPTERAPRRTQKRIRCRVFTDGQSGSI